jgi:hypothetical protein
MGWEVFADFERHTLHQREHFDEQALSFLDEE